METLHTSPLLETSRFTTQALAPANMPTVMLVDDDVFMHEVMSAALAGLATTHLHRAYNGRQAQQLMQSLKRRPDLLLCDIFMPDMDGIEFLGQLASSHYEGDIVLISGVDNNMLNVAREIAKGNGLKVLDTLTKPLPLHTLQSMLARYHHQQAPSEPSKSAIGTPPSLGHGSYQRQ